MNQIKIGDVYKSDRHESYRIVIAIKGTYADVFYTDDKAIYAVSFTNCHQYSRLGIWTYKTTLNLRDLKIVKILYA